MDKDPQIQALLTKYKNYLEKLQTSGPFRGKPGTAEYEVSKAKRFTMEECLVVFIEDLEQLHKLT